jgi:hypothetical protein
VLLESGYHNLKSAIECEEYVRGPGDWPGESYAPMSKALAEESGPSYDAARYLIDFLDEASKRSGYRPNGAKINELIEEDKQAGHTVSLPLPAKGFSDYQMECIQGYAQGLSYFRNVSSELSQMERSVEIRFRLTLSPEEKQSLSFSQRVQRAFMPRDMKLALLVGHILAGKGFKVREPTPAVLITRDKPLTGHGLQVRYPVSRGEDLAGVSAAYDRVLPMIADAFAREHGLRSETTTHDDVTTIFFTRDKSYLSSLYDNVMQFRIALPRKRSILMTDVAFFTRRSYRACRKLRTHYKNDFIMPKRPSPLWDDSGYCMVMLYKRGAGGKLVDTSYGHAVSNMAHQLAKASRLKASIEVHPEIRSIVANFSDRAKA